MNPCHELENFAQGQELLAKLTAVPDPRRTASAHHRLHELLFVALAGAIAGCDNWVEIEAFGNARLDWFRKFLTLPNGIPSHDTFGRV